MANEQQAAEWNGKNGDRWLANQERLDRMLTGCGETALKIAAAQPGEAVLDIGCGAGETSLVLARQVAPDGSVLGVDISGPLIGRARERASASAGLDFQLADASSSPFPDAHYDLLFSRFSVMFFDDPDAAFAHLRRALKPGGRLAFICWRSASENDWVRLPVQAISGIVPPPAPSDPEAPGPFSFGNRQRIERILASAGFIDGDIAPFDQPLLFGLGSSREEAAEDGLALALQIGPLSHMLADQDEQTRTRVNDALRALLADRYRVDEGVTIDGAAWFVTARNPV